MEGSCTSSPPRVIFTTRPSEYIAFHCVAFSSSRSIPPEYEILISGSSETPNTIPPVRAATTYPIIVPTARIAPTLNTLLKIGKESFIARCKEYKDIIQEKRFSIEKRLSGGTWWSGWECILWPRGSRQRVPFEDFYLHVSFLTFYHYVRTLRTKRFNGDLRSARIGLILWLVCANFLARPTDEEGIPDAVPYFQREACPIRQA